MKRFEPTRQSSNIPKNALERVQRPLKSANSCGELDQYRKSSKKDPRGRNGQDLDSLWASLTKDRVINDFEPPTPALHGQCAHCKEPILGDAVLALGKKYCQNHFVCQTCQIPLGTSPFYDKNGGISCEKCNFSDSATCTYCNLKIEGKSVTAMGSEWHVDCFVCNNCCQHFDGSYFQNEGMPYCPPCFQTMFATKCAGCHQAASGSLINACDKKWHPDCFVCTECREVLGQVFFAIEGKPYCYPHFQALRN